MVKQMDILDQIDFFFERKKMNDKKANEITQSQRIIDHAKTILNFSADLGK